MSLDPFHDELEAPVLLLATLPPRVFLEEDHPICRHSGVSIASALTCNVNAEILYFDLYIV